MTERPYFRTQNRSSRKAKIIINLSEHPLTQEEREAIQFADMPNTNMARAALTCYGLYDREQFVTEKDPSSPEIIVELPDSEASKD